MWKCVRTSILALALGLLVAVGYADSATVVSNLGATVNGSGTIYAAGPPQWYAQEFLTGSQSVQLGSVITDLGGASGTFTPLAELVSSNAGLPSTTVLTSFTIPSITSSFSDLTLTPTSSSVTLSANTDYWLVLWATGTGSYKWDYTSTLSSSFPNYASSSNGTTWTIGSPVGPFLMEVDSPTNPATPEPTSFALIGSGLLAFGLIRIRK